MHNVQVTPIIGLPQLDGWSHVTQNQSNTLIWTVSLHGNHARNVGRDLLDLISSTEPRTAAEFYQVFQQVVADAQIKDCSLSCAALFFEEQAVTFATFNAQILLRRDGRVGTLLDGLDTTKVIQGKSQVDDVFILATAQAVTFIDEIKLKIKQGYDVDSVVTSLTPSLQLEENTSLAALAFVHIKNALPVEEPRELPVNSDSIAPPSSVEEDLVPEPTQPSISQPIMEASVAIHSDASEATIDTNVATVRQFNESPEDSISNQPKQFTVDVSAYTDRAGTIVSKLSAFALSSGKSIFKSIKVFAGSHGKKVFVVYVPQIFKKFREVGIRSTGVSKKIFGQLTGKDVYISPLKSRVIARYAVAGIIIGLLVLGGLGWWQWQRRQQRIQVMADLAPITVSYETAQSQAINEPIQARNTLLSLQDQLQALTQSYQSKPAALAEITNLQTMVNQLYEEVSGKEEVQELPIFFNLSDIQSGFIGSDWALSDSIVSILDREAKQLLRFNINDKNGQVINLAEVDSEAIGQLRAVSGFNLGEDSTQETLILGNGILNVAADSESVATLVAPRVELEGGRLISAYATNMYVFNPQRQNIYRIPVEDGEAGTPLTWIRSSQGIQFDQVVSMTIDGDIWLGDREGTIVRMSTGRPEQFSISGLETAFSSSVLLYTRENFEHVYVLEPGANRLVVLSKDGTFVKEVLSASLASVTSLVVSENEETAYGLSGTLIYQLDL